MVTDIINVMLEELVHHRFELPGFTTLDRIAANARKSVNNRCFRCIVDQLSRSDKAQINDMLSRKRQDPTNVWQTLKREPKKTHQQGVTGTFLSKLPNPDGHPPD